jgi:hypothetical protein
MYCPNCRHIVSEDDNYCRACGHQLDSGSRAQDDGPGSGEGRICHRCDGIGKCSKLKNNMSALMFGPLAIFPASELETCQMCDGKGRLPT